MREITESTNKTVQKTLHFEENGETLSVTIGLENISPQTEVSTISLFLKTIFERLLIELNFDNSSL